MWTDPIIEELHQVRQEHAARFHNDLRAIVADLQRLEQEWLTRPVDPPPKPYLGPASYSRS